MPPTLVDVVEVVQEVPELTVKEVAPLQLSFERTTAIDIELVPEQLNAFVPVTVYVADAVTVVGVPDNCPVDVLKVKPLGNAGLTENVVGEPVVLGVTEVINVF